MNLKAALEKVRRNLEASGFRVRGGKDPAKKAMRDAERKRLDPVLRFVAFLDECPLACDFLAEQGVGWPKETPGGRAGPLGEPVPAEPPAAPLPFPATPEAVGAGWETLRGMSPDSPAVRAAVFNGVRHVQIVDAVGPVLKVREAGGGPAARRTDVTLEQIHPEDRERAKQIASQFPGYSQPWAWVEAGDEVAPPE